MKEKITPIIFPTRHQVLGEAIQGQNFEAYCDVADRLNPRHPLSTYLESSTKYRERLNQIFGRYTPDAVVVYRIKKKSS